MSYKRLLKPGSLLFIPMLIALAAIASACGGDDATPMPEPTAMMEAATDTPQPTPTPRPIEPESEAAIATAAPQLTPTPGVDELPGKQGGVLTMMIPYGPFGAGFDGYLSGWNPAYMNSPMYNELVHYNPETADPLDIRGDIADTWELSEDGLSYTFYLKDAWWHDDTPITAADIKYSLDDMTNPDEPRPWVGLIGPYYDNSEVINDKTVKVNMQYQAAAFFPYLGLDFMQMRPKHYLEGGADLATIENQLGSGPFKLKNYEPDVDIEYERNSNYWKPGLPYLDGIRYILLGSAGTVTAAHKTGQILMSATMVTHMTKEEALQLGSQAESEGIGTVLWAGPASHVNLHPNPNVEPFTDSRVRRAMSLAIHRQPLVEILTRGKGTLGYPFAPNYWFSLTEDEVAQVPGFRELNGEKHPDDIAEAQRLMEAAGYADGFQTEIMAGGGLDSLEAGQVVADQLRRFLNIDITLDVQEGATLDTRRRTGDFKMLSQSSGLLVIDPEDMFGRVYRVSGPGNYTKWEDSRIEDLFQQQTRISDRDERRVLALQAADILLEEAYTIGMYFVIRPMFLSSIVQNFNISPTAYTQNYKWEHIWCDPTCSDS
ncbi:MAG: ABC transporter substrate-binding protein [Dehalococcoidia bacterium]|nr:ABC transporter substrate-binding protein [Dehalococcoidia bacterium]